MIDLRQVKPIGHAAPRPLRPLEGREATPQSEAVVNPCVELPGFSPGGAEPRFLVRRRRGARLRGEAPRPRPGRKEPPMSQHLPAEGRPARPELPEPGEWLPRYGDVLYRYALARLRRPHEAEEAVQETLLAALKARGQFQGRSDPRTWLIGILKRKVLDRLRAAARAAP